MPGRVARSWLWFADKSDLDLQHRSELQSRLRSALPYRAGKEIPAHSGPNERCPPRLKHKPPKKEWIRRLRSATPNQKADTEPSADAAAAARLCTVGGVPEYENRIRAARC